MGVFGCLRWLLVVGCSDLHGGFVVQISGDFIFYTTAAVSFFLVRINNSEK